MESALKQRLIGAAVLVALAVIFLPMLIKGPAPESGASDIPLKLQDAPQGQFETRELPLVTPGDAPKGGAVGLEPAEGASLPTVDTAATAASTSSSMMPAATAGGDYAVSFGSYASAADAQRVVQALRTSQLPGYQETTSAATGRTLYRVRIGPYASQADAEAARLRAAQVRNDVGAKVVVLDADDSPAPASTAASVSTPVASAAPPVSAPVPLAESKPTPPAALPPEPAKPAASKPAPAQPVAKAPTAAKPVAEPTRPAAAGVGFAVQLGAFANADDAGKLRDRARAAGFSAFVEQVRTDKGTLSRVRVGPVASRGDADQLKAQVAARIGVSGIVRPHP
ncbi:SPOR domain-containing protein [Lysobacter cavernae]|uniref:SPOR domain-containing protein n=1 Tax=Lysobacter cavernae TaxID=1685901 RepID=A0ABV7RKS6_9GAMM